MFSLYLHYSRKATDYDFSSDRAEYILISIVFRTYRDLLLLNSFLLTIPLRKWVRPLLRDS